MKIVVFGATGGSGRAIVRRALAEGHDVTAFVRDASKLETAPGLTVVEGDVMQDADVARAIEEPDAVVVSLGNSQNAFALLLGARRTTPRNVCEVGTRHVLDAMKSPSPAPLIVVSAFGVGDTRQHLPWMFKLFYRLFLREQIADKERQEALVKASGADYVLVQPVALTDAAGRGDWFASSSGERRGQEIARADLAVFIVAELAQRRHCRQTVTLSG